MEEPLVAAGLEHAIANSVNLGDFSNHMLISILEELLLVSTYYYVYLVKNL